MQKKIVADADIYAVDEVFAPLGNIVKVPGNAISRDSLQDADGLLIRSVTRIDKKLLEHTPVKFVGSCTIGTDHMDLEWLQQQGIEWGNAPGCNASAVVQYVLSAMSAVRPDWRQRTIGIVGLGSIGSLLLRLLKQLGVNCLCCDPFKYDEGVDLVALPTLLSSADIITLHTPLTQEGPFPSYHLLGSDELALLKPGALIVNSARGPVIDNFALIEYLSRQTIDAVLDVWEHEPTLSLDLLDRVCLATPHIAGYTIQGKANATQQIYKAYLKFLGKKACENPNTYSRNQFLSPRLLSNLPGCRNNICKLNALLLTCYDIRKDDELFRSTIKNNNSSDHKIAKSFENMRQSYALRPGYSSFKFPENYLSDEPTLTMWLNSLLEIDFL